MYEHPYLSQQITRFEQEQMERSAERARFIAEHADQIVARPQGVIRRMLGRLAAGSRTRAQRPSPTTCEPVAAR
ncbi:hypothetical protein [Microbacterium sp. MYb72]|uniref:hypothetical protein n=1 Tax=Microbacterium sp. MYb72 TaxID=1848693 RepID=UPI0015E2996B|nr:hypothetical protein [Microbacterium sp. MYb72]